MRQPGTFSIADSFGGKRPLFEVMDELAAEGHEVVVDRDGAGALFLRADDCEWLLGNRALGAAAVPVLELSGVTDGPLHELWSVLMFGKDGEEHRRLRGSVNRFFTAAAVAEHEGFLAALAATLAADLPRDRDFDLWDTFALPLAGAAVCRFSGIPAVDIDRVVAWSSDLVAAFGTMAPDARGRAEAAAAQFCAYLDDLLARPDRLGAGSVAAGLVSDPGPLSFGEVRGLVANVTFGGLDAIAKALTTGVFHLLAHDRWQQLCTAPERSGVVVEELLRFFPPTGATVRTAREPLSCRGVAINPQQMVLPSLRAACRDPRLFTDPDRLDIDRRPGKPFAFGAGPHFCLGIHLAKLALATALAALAQRLPGLRPAGPSAQVRWGGSPFYGVESLLLRGSDQGG